MTIQFESRNAPKRYGPWLESIWSLRVEKPITVFALPDCQGHFIAAISKSVEIAFEPPCFRGSSVILAPDAIYFGLKLQPGIRPGSLEFATNAISVLSEMANIALNDLESFTSQMTELLDDILTLHIEPSRDHCLLRQFCDQMYQRSTVVSQLSDRQFRRIVCKLTGVSPKKLMRSIRIRKALESIGAGELKVDAAILHGFADQSHLTRECVTFTGYPPGDLLSLFPGSF